MIYSKNLLLKLSGRKKFLPYNVCPQKFITVSIEGISLFTFSFDIKSMDEPLVTCIEILAKSLKQIYKIYKKEYNFLQPLLVYKLDSKIISFSIGLVAKKKSARHKILT